jgi:hypothetical protein
VFSRSRFPIVVLWTIIATLMIADNAKAYVGPGAGMEFITYAISLLAMVGLAFFSIIMWPFYSFVRWIRGNKPAAKTEQQTATAPAAEALNPATSPAPQNNAQTTSPSSSAP